MQLPFAPPFCEERVIANSLVMPIIDALVGEDCVFTLQAGGCRRNGKKRCGRYDARALLRQAELTS